MLMSHVLFGMACVLCALWVFVDTLHAADANLWRIRAVSRGAAAAMWTAFLIAGYWYIAFYPADKATILKGPWPFAHSFFMESKEHFVIMLLLLVTYLPIAAAGDLAANRDARKVVLWVSGIVVALALAADLFGAIIALGVKVALMPG
ncbi:MAG: hypothetical protein ABSA05_13185 [Opitutaceae bacterium]